jgi:hypothetical protein
MRLRGIRFNISIQPLFRSIEWTILGITGHLAPGSRGMQPEGPETSLVSFPTDTLQNVGLHDSPSLERGGKTFIWQDNPGTIQQAFLPAPAVTLMVIEG